MLAWYIKYDNYVFAFQDAKCELCEFLINIIDQELGQNSSLDKINNTIYSICNLLPDAIKATVRIQFNIVIELFFKLIMFTYSLLWMPMNYIFCFIIKLIIYRDKDRILFGCQFFILDNFYA